MNRSRLARPAQPGMTETRKGKNLVRYVYSASPYRIEGLAALLPQAGVYPYPGERCLSPNAEVKV